ncbi:ribonuclease H-like domain-containing protein [Tanacetum coccineum]|uniref:Ribonuclease H-like domain-containing protein n=1 Tax=Tanacetum coccineum TaxID=301880 RepID=A0ABQ5HB80_9ASTR
MDKIVLSWIFTTLLDPLQKRLVVARSSSAKAAWKILTDIVKDNKRSRTFALKTELRSVQVGTLSMKAYFQKIESLVTILQILDCIVNDEDVVHYALQGLPEKYNQVCGYMHYQTTFSDLNTARTLLITEEMRLKSKEVALPADSSSPIVLMAQSGRFGSECKYVHDSNEKPTSNVNPQSSSTNNTEELLVKLLDKLGLKSTSYNATGAVPLHTPSANLVYHVPRPNVSTPSPTANPPYYTNPIQSISTTPGTSPMLLTGPRPFYYPPGPTGPPPGFSQPTATPQQFGPTMTQPNHLTQPVASIGVGSIQGLTGSQPGTSGSVTTPGHATLLPQAFAVGTLHDPNTGAWNMDTSASSHLNSLINSLSMVFNSCLYPSISVGDGHSIPVTNTGHNILPTITRPLHLNIVLITPHIVKNLISVRQFVRENNCTIEFDSFGFSVKDFMTRRLLLRCDSRDPSAIHFGGSSSNTDGTLSRYKARLVANGSTQLEGIDVDETFSPVVKPGTIRTVLSLATSRHWPVHQLDVKNAFLHGDLFETVYMHQPPGFWDSTHPDYTDIAYLLLYVDDIVLTTSSSDLLHRIISSLHQEFAMTDLGSLNYFLGISVTRDSSGMFLSQKKYAVEIFERAGMVNCNPSRTPVDTESKLGTTGDVVSDPTLYRSLAGSLQYLTFTRPDISYAVQQVCLHMHDPREPHFSALKRILRYVCGTLDYGLQLFSSSTTDLVAYSDADWAGCPTTRRSTSGYCVFLGNNLLSWSAKRQPTLSRSSAEAEYRGVANAVAETCWLRNLLRELHTPLSSATLVYCDNVRFLHVPSRYQFTDIFTKGLPTALFEEFRSSLSVRCPPAQTAGEC